MFLEIRRAVWGLPQAGILANKLLRKGLELHGYYECVNTPGLWRHATRPITFSPITFSLVVDDFGIKYVGKEHADHLIKCLKEKYKLTEDWTGNSYCGITLDWDYAVRTLDISMPGYIKKQLVKYKHIRRRVQHCPYLPEPKKYGADAQSPLPTDETRKLTDAKIKQVQKNVGSILCYARAADMTVLMALSTIVSEQTKGTEKNIGKGVPTLGLFGVTPKCKGQILCIGHGHEHPFRCFVFKQTKCTQQSVWDFFHGQSTNRWKTHKTQRRISHIVCDTAIRCSVCGQSRIGSVVPKLPGGDEF